MQNEEEKKWEGQKNPEELLQEVGKEVSELKDDIVDSTINANIQYEKSELDNLQNTIIGSVEKNTGTTLEKEKVLGDTPKNINDRKKEVVPPYQPAKNKVEAIVSPEVILANQTKSRLNVERKLVPIAGMPSRLVNKLDASK